MNDTRLPPSPLAPASANNNTGSDAALHNGNISWWTTNPMQYDWKTPPTVSAEQMGQAELAAIDARFFHASYFAQRQGAPAFSALLPEKLAGVKVLEVGCGFGSHAQLFAQRGAIYSGIDLTSPAVAATRRRLQITNLPGRIIRANAEQLPFPNDHFDLVWSWGVIHHTADTRRALAEIARVVKPAGEVRLMVYHKQSIARWVTILVRGVMHGELRHMSSQQLVDKYTDGYLARAYSRQEWENELTRHWLNTAVEVLGNRYEVPLPLPRQARHRVLDRVAPPLLDVPLRSRGSMLFSISSGRQ